jgi:hypothetical protein
MSLVTINASADVDVAELRSAIDDLRRRLTTLWYLLANAGDG